MSPIDGQVHDKFKLFAGPLAPDGTLGELAGEVEAWVRSAGVAPKSIGVEFLESNDVLVLSIGYRDDEPGYGVAISAVHVGRVEGTDSGSLAKVEQGMVAASRQKGNIICHELYVTEDDRLLMVFMSRLPTGT